MPTDIELHLEVAQPISAIDLLSQACEQSLSRSRLKQVMTCGAVWLENGQGIKRLRRAKVMLKPQETLHLYYDAQTIDAPVPAATLLADMGEYSVWLKPQGMYSQGTKWGDHHTLSRWAEQNLTPQRPAKLVHRLDRFTWGVMLLAHSKSMAAELTRLFREREISKVYQAITVAAPAVVGESFSMDAVVDGKAALSHITVLAEEGGLALCEVAIETGRKHQVRSHLAAAGTPILGDRLFGQGHKEAEERLAAKPELDMQLCARSIAFQCPVTGRQASYHCPEELRPSLKACL